MKTTIALCSTAIILFAAAFPTRANIIAGPIINPTNGHEYYLLTPSFWNAAEDEAEDMGGTLAIVRNAGEQDWIISTFGHLGRVPRCLWIGLHRTKSNGEFVWVDDTPLDYTRWFSGEPNNSGGNENCVHMQPDLPVPGTWNDLNGDNQISGVVEVQKKSPKALTESERALVGDWYESGRLDRPCHIAGTDNILFALNESNNASGRAILTRKGFLFVAAWDVHGEIVKDRILWSNGTWWSRKPVEYNAGEKSSDKDAPKFSPTETSK